eukprot:TRINITY_DN25443_c0_g1_i1.p1 TRINITY_DN25443_c0_g1~~TRINITY_DN25443_c0_g1_i1.p1  ORF type:complete len:217 (+),score=55.55 TRINITY_DN25443_c0_g1_i1:100-750(+)
MMVTKLVAGSVVGTSTSMALMGLLSVCTAATVYVHGVLACGAARRQRRTRSALPDMPTNGELRYTPRRKDASGTDGTPNQLRRTGSRSTRSGASRVFASPEARAQSTPIEKKASVEVRVSEGYDFRSAEQKASIPKHNFQRLLELRLHEAGSENLVLRTPTGQSTNADITQLSFLESNERAAPLPCFESVLRRHMQLQEQNPRSPDFDSCESGSDF